MRERGFLTRLFSGTLMAVLALVLAACSAGSILTDSAPSAGNTAPGKPVPPVAFREIKGIPPGKLAELKGALSSAGGQHDVGFVEGSFQAGVFSISGDFRATSESAGVRIVYQWQFRDADGVLVDNIDGEDNAGVYSGADPWGGVSTAVLDRIARRTAERVAQKLSQIGYATRLARLTEPPAELFAQAAPDAGREIDFETVHGPGMAEIGAAMMANADVVVKQEDIAPAVASVEPIAGEGVMPKIALAEGPSMPAPGIEEASLSATATDPAAARVAPSSAGDPAPRKKPKPGQREIRSVAVVPVTGSPGGGDAELTAAMRKTLSAAGWPVVSKPQPDALTVEGRVNIAEKGNAQSVSVRWAVKAPDGKTLGDVKQANDVPKGALDNGWGGAATAVAEAAATGIFDIVKRYR